MPARSVMRSRSSLSENAPAPSMWIVRTLFSAAEARERAEAIRSIADDRIGMRLPGAGPGQVPDGTLKTEVTKAGCINKNELPVEFVIGPDFVRFRIDIERMAFDIAGSAEDNIHHAHIGLPPVDVVAEMFIGIGDPGEIFLHEFVAFGTGG